MICSDDRSLVRKNARGHWLAVPERSSLGFCRHAVSLNHRTHNILEFFALTCYLLAFVTLLSAEVECPHLAQRPFCHMPQNGCCVRFSWSSLAWSAGCWMPPQKAVVRMCGDAVCMSHVYVWVCPYTWLWPVCCGAGAKNSYCCTLNVTVLSFVCVASKAKTSPPENSSPILIIYENMRPAVWPTVLPLVPSITVLSFDSAN